MIALVEKMDINKHNGESKQDMQVFQEMALSSNGGLSEMLFINLRDAIFTGRLPSGYRFPNENEMCKVLNVGRSTLREAYIGLVVLNLVARKKSGTFVNNIEALKNSLPFNQSLDQYQINDLMEFRGMLEEEIARIAAKNAVESDIAELEETLKQMKDHIDDIVILTICDTQFHIKMSKISKNELLIDVYKVVRKHVENMIHYAFKVDEEIRHSAIYYHEKLIEAVKSNSPDLARQLMHEHMRNVQDTICD